ncbi:hypothetical protein E2C01_086851 [Portunus trituberculatus]|uniref:Uncharacterized protein n=1 Tax=Portunus trituberculatus TaxID=210409 RepID=A0A5B7J6G6_PORTR|nr:hypothetical protein [Portunus trituberculatus]
MPYHHSTVIFNLHFFWHAQPGTKIAKAHYHYLKVELKNANKLNYTRWGNGFQFLRTVRYTTTKGVT